MGNKIDFVSDNKILLDTASGSTLLCVLNNMTASGHPVPQAELLAWAQIAATRENTAQFSRLAEAIEKMAAAGADQAAAVREQTAKMQQNIDDARNSATTIEEAIKVAEEQLGPVIDRLTGGNGGFAQVLFGDPKVENRG